LGPEVISACHRETRDLVGTGGIGWRSGSRQQLSQSVDSPHPTKVLGMRRRRTSGADSVGSGCKQAQSGGQRRQWSAINHFRRGFSEFHSASALSWSPEPYHEGDRGPYHKRSIWSLLTYLCPSAIRPRAMLSPPGSVESRRLCLLYRLESQRQVGQPFTTPWKWL